MFYRGPVGQKFLQIMPQTMQDSMTIGQKFGEFIALDTRNRMIEEPCASAVTRSDACPAKSLPRT